MLPHANPVAPVAPESPPPRHRHLNLVRGRFATYVGQPTLFDIEDYVDVDHEATVVRDGFLLTYRGHTLTGYRTDLRLWFRWCLEHDVRVLDARRVDIESMAQAMAAAGAKPATIQRRLVTICGFYRYAEQEEVIERSPGRYVRRPHVPNVSTSAYLDRVELVVYLNAAETISARHAALACLLAINGLRVSEAVGAHIDDLALGVKGHHTLTVVRKGGNEEAVPLTPRTFRNVIAAIDDRRTGAILLDSYGGQMTRHAAARAVRLIAKRAGIDKAIGPHALRHSFVSLGLDFGIPLRDMQLAAGHANPETTVRYDRRDRNLDKHASYIVAAVLGN